MGAGGSKAYQPGDLKYRRDDKPCGISQRTFGRAAAKVR